MYRLIFDHSGDGGDHDPRFEFRNKMIQCRCGELAAFAQGQGGGHTIWDGTLAATERESYPTTTICDPSQQHGQDLLSAINENDTSVINFHEPVILLARRDDYNPSFQISSALNAWVVTKALNWDLSKTKVVHLDDGYPSPVDELHQKLLSPSHEIVKGQDLVGKQVWFHSQVMLAPIENSGPMMQHLDNEEPCFNSDLFDKFCSLALEILAVSGQQAPLAVQAHEPVVVTVISRRPYNRRRVQCVWTSEAEILDKIRAEYKHLNVVFQPIDFVDLTMAQQMQTVINSDIVVGMHDAGLVNVFWTRPQTLVVEIFPRQRFRWGTATLSVP